MKNQSEQLEAFLNWVEDVPRMVVSAEERLHKAEDEETDLSHFLELEDPDRTELYRAGRKLQQVLKERREAKDELDNLEAVAAWAENNQGAINKLKGVLGEMRKVEKRWQNRLYHEKTNVLEGIKHGRDS